MTNVTSPFPKCKSQPALAATEAQPVSAAKTFSLATGRAEGGVLQRYKPEEGLKTLAVAEAAEAPE
jgi:hypothetical protein